MHSYQLIWKFNSFPESLTKALLVGDFFINMTWRDSCRPIIAKVLADNKDLTEKEIRKALRNAYPFRQRAMHPYKIWCDEIKRQRGQKKPLGAPQFIDSPNQTKLL